MRFRLRLTSGQTVPFGADMTLETPLRDLRQAIAAIANAAPDQLLLRRGMPPAPFAPDADPAASIGSLGLRDGETLILQVTTPDVIAAAASVAAASTPAKSATATATATASAPPRTPATKASVPAPYQASAKAKPATATAAPAAASSTSAHATPEARVVVMDDDNSCLFRAVSYVLDGHPRNHPSYRELAAVAVQSDTDTFSEAVLGRPPDAYVAWITGPDRWGGAIELAALAQATRHELLVADVETGRIDVFGEGQGHPVRSALVYSGIHYDAAEIALPDGRVVREWPVPGASAAAATATATTGTGDGVLNSVTADPNAEAVRVAASALRAARQFTNTAQFTLRCSDCGQALRGEKEAQSHAASRGHVNFVEY